MTNKTLDVDALAQEIRRVDGSHSLGAGALAEALMPFLSQQPAVDEATINAIADMAEWHRNDGRTHLSIRVADGADLSCKAFRRAALTAAIGAQHEQ